ncbi:MAG: type I methionyl aminopeptidase [bacterium]|nr:type I methionyl aminopeptidase [bacterium]
MKTKIKTVKEIADMRSSGKILTEVLTIVTSHIKEGITPKQLDKIAKDETDKRGAKPAFLDYRGFPASLCVSVNDQIVHALPDDRKLKQGDIVGLDFGINYNGMITDSAITVGVGKINEQADHLLKETKKALYRAVDIIKDGIRIGDISATIEESLTKANLKIIKSLTGHGVGHQLHEDPSIPNFGTKGTGQTLRAGMTIAIEPIASISSEKLKLADNGWTCLTSDGSLSAHFEHTILITKKGSEILT